MKFTLGGFWVSNDERFAIECIAPPSIHPDAESLPKVLTGDTFLNNPGSNINIQCNTDIKQQEPTKHCYFVNPFERNILTSMDING